MLKKTFKFVLYFTLAIVVVINLVILFSGRIYLYKGLWNTYLTGQSGPSATEYLIFENRKVDAKNGKPLLHSKLYNTAKIPSETETILDQFNALALVIVKNDSLIHEQYWDSFSDTSHTNSFSVSKTYCGILLGCALKDGYVKSLDQPISDFIPEFKEGGKAKVTLRHLATMTSGIDFNESYINPFAYPAEGYYGCDVLGACLYRLL